MNTTCLPTLFSTERFVLDDAYTVMAEIPGVRMEDIHVEIEGSQVMITAEVKKDMEDKKPGHLLRSERSDDFASRMFTLRFEIDRAKAVAKYIDGVLTLTLPKKMSTHTEPLIVQ